MSKHPFDRYADFTDVATLKEFSERPLRKCIRVNTLKMEVDEFTSYAKEKQWQLEPVLWCKEGFFIDREDRSEALGKDILHMLGHTYMQEASSMLPVALLDPKPGEAILDMAAAPGSKSTQIGALMKGEGVLVANDMSDLRLRTLVTALNRLGVTNVRVTKKVGQWFAKNMTARFNRVLIDAPCTGQGTSRKDPNALTYCSEHSIGKNAKLQRELIESAIHATKIGGRIVYSTCTLTPEENEDVILSALSKMPGQIKIVDPREIVDWDCSKAIEDSYKVQQSIDPKAEYPMLRIWPQTYDSEGFFCAVLEKTAPTKEIEKIEALKATEEWMPKYRKVEIQDFFTERFGTKLIADDEVLLQKNERVWLTNEKTLKFPIPAPHVAIGLPLGKLLQKSPIKMDHDFVTLRGAQAKTNIVDLTDEQWDTLIKGQDIDCPPEIHGHVLLRYKGMCIGRARATEGRLKNHLPRWMVLMHS